MNVLSQGSQNELSFTKTWMGDKKLAAEVIKRDTGRFRPGVHDQRVVQDDIEIDRPRAVAERLDASDGALDLLQEG